LECSAWQCWFCFFEQI